MSKYYRRKRSTGLEWQVGILVAIALVVGVVAYSTSKDTLDNHYSHRRTLKDVSLVNEIDGDGCGAESALKRPGLVLWIVLIIYIFVGLAIICDDFFVPSLEKIAHAMDLSEDVAGATLMAGGTSSPELFAALVSIFLDPDNDSGPSTILGSVVFNIGAIIGASILVSDGFVKLKGFALFRDVSFNVVAFALLYLFENVIGDATISIAESAVLLIVYVLYVISMKYSDSAVKMLGWQDLSRDVWEDLDEHHHHQRQRPKALQLQSFDLDGDATSTGKEPPKDGIFKILFLYPWYFVYGWTIPNCEKQKWARWYPVTFGMCIVWLAITSFLMVDLAAKVGDCVGFNANFTGFTLLAIGSSLPDMISSMIASQGGKCEMAVSNALGSNVFDVYIGLGIPLFLHSVIFQESTAIPTASFELFVFALVILIVFVFLVLRNKMFLERWHGYFLIFCYFVFIAILVVEDVYHRL